MHGPALRDVMLSSPSLARLLVAATLVASVGGCSQLPSAPHSVEASSPIAQIGAGFPSDVAAATRHPARHKVVREAKDALLGVVAGEKVYFQRFTTFINAADAAEIRSVLGVELGAVADRWHFSVRDASTDGFTAVAEGRRRTRATGISVLLHFERGQPITWSVERHRR